MRGSSQRTHIGHPKMLAMHGIFKEKERRFAPQRKRRLAYLRNSPFAKTPATAPSLKMPTFRSASKELAASHTRAARACSRFA